MKCTFMVFFIKDPLHAKSWHGLVDPVAFIRERTKKPMLGGGGCQLFFFPLCGRNSKVM
jgi:hypothetical protein